MHTRTWHVNIDGDDSVTASHHAVGVVVVTTAIGTAAHADHPPRLGHLIVDLQQNIS